jgi:hypothetical protein
MAQAQSYVMRGRTVTCDSQIGNCRTILQPGKCRLIHVTVVPVQREAELQPWSVGEVQFSVLTSIDG